MEQNEGKFQNLLSQITEMEEQKSIQEQIVEKRAKDIAWAKIFEVHNLRDHDFDVSPYSITATEIKKTATGLIKTPEPRILCKQDTRESRPRVFQEKGLFILPTRNGVYSIVKGEGYLDIPPIEDEFKIYNSKLNFLLDTAKIGDSEMQHLDFAYASSLIRTFLDDESLVLTIRGRKYTPDVGFRFFVGEHEIEVKSVQTEVDAGYEGRKQIVLIEAKAKNQHNTIIRQLYYPFRQWQHHTTKKVVPIFFDKFQDIYRLWQFRFKDVLNYNSIELVKSQSFQIVGGETYGR